MGYEIRISKKKDDKCGHCGGSGVCTCQVCRMYADEFDPLVTVHCSACAGTGKE